MRWGLEFTTTFSRKSPLGVHSALGRKYLVLTLGSFFKIFLFLAALSFHCFARGFSLVAEVGATLHCGYE